jgi:uncharacterized membrane protein
MTARAKREARRNTLLKDLEWCYEYINDGSYVAGGYVTIAGGVCIGFGLWSGMIVFAQWLSLVPVIVGILALRAMHSTRKEIADIEGELAVLEARDIVDTINLDTYLKAKGHN